MADDKDSAGAKAVADGRLEVQVGRSGATSGDFGNGADGKAKTADGFVAADVGLEEDDLEDGAKEKPAEGGEKPEGADDKETGGGAEEGGDAEAPVGELGEWNKDDPEVAEKFDKHYWTEDGQQLDFGRFTEELTANLKNGVADINKATRAYVKDRLGVSDAFINHHIAGTLALNEQNDAKFYGIVGGKETYEEKLTWAKDGYTADQKARFNAALQAGGEQAEEALELLNSRYTKATGKADPKTSTETPQRKGPPGRRAASPKKSATENAEPAGRSPAVQPFASSEEHRKAQSEALRSKDPAKLAEVHRRLAASKFWRE